MPVVLEEALAEVYETFHPYDHYHACWRLVSLYREYHLQVPLLLPKTKNLDANRHFGFGENVHDIPKEEKLEVSATVNQWLDSETRRQQHRSLRYYYNLS